MGLSLHLFHRVHNCEETHTVYECNITHNVGAIADAVGIYRHIWRPEEIGIKTAGELIGALTGALESMCDPRNAERLNALNPANGWGSLDGFVRFISKYLRACHENPAAEIWTSR